MKKSCVLFLVFVLVLSLCSCQRNTPQSENKSIVEENRVEESIEHSGKKINGEITGASLFSEGLAFVCLNGNKEKTYCITQEGYIVFELDKKMVVNGNIYSEFKNGLAKVENGLINTKGEITYPEDVGVSEFYCIALDGGYIVAKKTTADYSTTKNELGVMNTSFEWIIEPSEELYATVENSLFSTNALNTKSYYANDIIYFAEDKCYLNLKTGEFLDDYPTTTPSSSWLQYTDFTYRNEKEAVVLDLNNLTNLYLYSNFNNGKAGVVFFNAEASEYYFTLIDEVGEFCFEPKSCGKEKIRNIKYDGANTILITIDDNFKDSKAKTYTVSGDFISEFSVDELEYMSYIFDISDGIIALNGYYNYSAKAYYYTAEFKPLFETK